MLAGYYVTLWLLINIFTSVNEFTLVLDVTGKFVLKIGNYVWLYDMVNVYCKILLIIDKVCSILCSLSNSELYI